MNPSGSPCSASYASNASNGLVRITPPKSQSTALITGGDPTVASGSVATLPSRHGPHSQRQPNAHLTHFIVDGSNIATEGRALPSLQQLNDAVMAFIEEHPDALITVVVDATFGHRIDKKEVRAFDEAVANNELVTPPAGAVGRGDAFVLTIANKAKAGILSNDSFQEFHGDYAWLFDEGRLIGGKPVPHVGWVFVERLPVRGPKSRQSVKDAKGQQTKTAAGERRPRVGQQCRRRRRRSRCRCRRQPPPGPAAAAKSRRPAADTAAVVAASRGRRGGVTPAAKTAVNDLLPFLDFVEHHPVGTGVHGGRRELRLARRLRPGRRRAGLPPAAADGRSDAAQRPRRGGDRRGDRRRDRGLRAGTPQHRRRPRLGRRGRCP